MPADRAPVLWTGLWIALMAAVFLARPLLPVDETRYLAAAWEMWHRSDFLVPHLNGETYSHKPPLLFWLFHAGWALFGVNDWWPRLVAPAFGLGCLFLTAALARHLWPDRRDLGDIAALILFGCVFWTLFTTLTMFDMIVAFFALLGLIGIAIAWRARTTGHSSFKGWLLLILGIGFGLLAKGPAILLHTLPVALLAPFWSPAKPSPASGEAPAPRRGLGSWYGGIVLATLAGTAIVLAWALPAAWAGGTEYAHAIFWGQSAGRMVDSFAHERPWWWYAAVLPGLILPWIVWPRLWHAVQSAAKDALGDSGVRFCLCWFLPAFVAFSFISGKQLHYLLPEFPALALLFAYFLVTTESETATAKRATWPPALFFIGLGAAIVFATEPLMPAKFQARYANLAAQWAGLIMLAGAVILWLPANGLRRAVTALTALSFVVAVAAHLVARPMLARNFDVEPLAKKLGEWERRGIPLANVNKYHGQYHFLGRLKKPMTVIGDQAPDMEIWMHAFPEGRAVSYHYKLPTGAVPVYVQPYKGKFIAVWESKTMLENPGIARRN